MKTVPLLLLAFFMLATACKQNTQQTDVPKETQQTVSPDERFGDLFAAVQMARVFPDGKTFVDCEPKFTTEQILAAYADQKDDPNFDLAAFVKENFHLPESPVSDYKTDRNDSAEEHMEELWDVLTRQSDTMDAGSLIPLPKSYIVPGGRFREIYYWDSYFTMLGLQISERTDIVQNMVDNFAYLIDLLGFIPNGNRTYYMSRSQPPFFAMMVQVLAEMQGEEVYTKYLPQLRKEYAFWMDGSDKTMDTTRWAHRRLVQLEEGKLNRHWDDKNTPRPESYREDVETAEKSGRPAEEVYRELRAGAESGWDFSSRWFRDGRTLATIHTTDIIPVDLNTLLYNLERTIAKGYQLKGDNENADAYNQRAEARKQAIIRYCWNPASGFFEDYDFVANEFTGKRSLAAMFPLFFKIADEKQAASVAKSIERDFLKAGGVVSTLSNTGQQWDAPNGWAPLQFITIEGLRHYGHHQLAKDIKQRWVDLNVKVYRNTGKMLEKYNVMDLTLEAGGGEYPVQDGFGWTNGVLLRLLTEKAY
ncbi:MAG: alpha,alpha-trehalase TreF [Saprospiraceae bacterium]